MATINLNNSELGKLFNFYSDTKDSKGLLFNLHLSNLTRREYVTHTYNLLDNLRESNHISELRNHRKLLLASINGGQIQDDILDEWCLENKLGSVTELFEFLIKDFDDQTFELGNKFLNEIEVSYVAAQVANAIENYAKYISPLWNKLSDQEFTDEFTTRPGFIDTIRSEAINNFYDPNLFAVRMNTLFQNLRELGFEL